MSSGSDVVSFHEEILHGLTDSLLIFDGKTGEATFWNRAAAVLLNLGDCPKPYQFSRSVAGGSFSPDSVCKRAIAVRASNGVRHQLRLLRAGLSEFTVYDVHWKSLTTECWRLLVTLRPASQMPEMTLAHPTPFAASHLQHILESVPVAIVACTLEGIVTYWNQAAQTVYGWSAQETLGRPNPLSNGDEELGERLRQMVFARERFTFSASRKGKDGQCIEVRLTVSSWADHQGVLRGFLEMTEDISDMVKQERALEQTRREILQMQKMEAVGRLAGGMAHDFNNLLLVVKCNAELQMASNRVDLEMLQEIQEAATRGEDLTRKLLTFARSSNTVFREFNLQSCVQGFLPLLQRAARRGSCSVHYRPGEPELMLLGDPNQLEGILMNLVLNATDASVGSTRVEIRTFSDWLQTSHSCRTGCLEPGPYAILEIEDNGCGMSSKHQERLFEPFFTTKDEGTGLGLAIAYGSVREHGGGLEVESQEGSGSLFRIFLPLKKRTTEIPPALPSESPSNSLEIALVEDLEHIRNLVSKLLTLQGYRVQAYSTAAQAQADIENEAVKPCLLISDVVLHNESGLELARCLRASHSFPILLMSGHSQEAQVHEFPFLAKPFSASQLLGQIESLLGARGQ